MSASLSLSPSAMEDDAVCRRSVECAATWLLSVVLRRGCTGACGARADEGGTGSIESCNGAAAAGGGTCGCGLGAASRQRACCSGQWRCNVADVGVLARGGACQPGGGGGVDGSVVHGRPPRS